MPENQETYGPSKNGRQPIRRPTLDELCARLGRNKKLLHQTKPGGQYKDHPNLENRGRNNRVDDSISFPQPFIPQSPITPIDWHDETNELKYQKAKFHFNVITREVGSVGKTVFDVMDYVQWRWGKVTLPYIERYLMELGD